MSYKKRKKKKWDKSFSDLFLDCDPILEQLSKEDQRCLSAKTLKAIEDWKKKNNKETSSGENCATSSGNKDISKGTSSRSNSVVSSERIDIRKQSPEFVRIEKRRTVAKAKKQEDVCKIYRKPASNKNKNRENFARRMSSEPIQDLGIQSNEVQHMVTLNEDLPSRDEPMPEDTSFQHHEVGIEIREKNDGSCQMSIKQDVSFGYEIEIRRHKALISIDKYFTRVVVPDYDVEKSRLKKRKYVIVSRTCCSDDGGNSVRWLFGCSCDEAEFDLVNALNFDAGHTQTEDSLCIHIKALRNILHELEDWEENEDENLDEDEDNPDNPLNYVPEQPEDDVSEIIFDMEKLLVVTGGSVGVVSNNLPTSRFFCHICMVTYCRHCAHLKLTKDENILVQDFIAANEIIQPTNSARILNPAVSTKKVQFSQGTSAIPLVNLPRDEEGLIICQDSFSCCSDDEISSTTKLVNLYDKNHVYKCKVLSKYCTRCRSSQRYDGSEQCILNMGKFLIHHDLLRDYMLHFLIGNSCTLNGYYQILAISQENGGNSSFRKSIKYQDFKDAWYSFLDLLDISFAEGATCLECGEHPECVVCDATSLGHQKKFSALVLNEDTNETPTPKFSEYRDRLAIPRKHNRKNLKKWVSKKLQPRELQSFLKEMEATHPDIFKVMMWYEDEPLDSVVDIFQCLYSSSPVCSFIFPSEYVFGLMTDLFDPDVKSSVTKMRQLQEHCPLFFNLLREVSGSCLPEDWKDLIDNLIVLACVPYPDSEPVSTQKCNNLANHIGSFPNLPIKRKRGTYHQDTKSKKKKKECRKNYSGHPNLTSGIFTLYCQHGICYGYQVMHKEESPDTPFTIFKTRFPQGPKMVIYDNCCALHSYCLNRDPVFFKDTLFLIDRFHWKNHRACSFGYCLARYPSYKDVNSQINEQQNAATKRLKTQLSYMRPDNFVKHCDLFFWYRNKLKKDKM